jgi:hypothetical protein
MARLIGRGRAGRKITTKVAEESGMQRPVMG